MSFDALGAELPARAHRLFQNAAKLISGRIACWKFRGKGVNRRTQASRRLGYWSHCVEKSSSNWPAETAKIQRTGIMKSITELVGACLCCSLVSAPAKAQDSAGKLTNEMCPQGYSLVVGLCIAEQTGDVVLPVDIEQAKK